GLKDRLNHYPRTLSGGEQQRVSLARAFVQRPAILFADEPTGSLDEQNGRRVTDLMFGLHEEQGTSLVLVTHDPALAARCHRELRLSGGRLLLRAALDPVRGKTRTSGRGRIAGAPYASFGLSVWPVLLCDVLAVALDGCTAATACEVGGRPKRTAPQLLADARVVPFADHPAGNAFQAIHQRRDSHLGRVVHQQVDVIVLAVELHQFRL